MNKGPRTEPAAWRCGIERALSILRNILRPRQLGVPAERGPLMQAQIVIDRKDYLFVEIRTHHYARAEANLVCRELVCGYRENLAD